MQNLKKKITIKIQKNSNNYINKKKQSPANQEIKLKSQ